MKKILISLSIIIIFGSSCSLFNNDSRMERYISSELEIIKNNDIDKYNLIMSISEPEDVYIIVKELITYKSDSNKNEFFEDISEAIIHGYGDCEEFSLLNGFFLFYFFDIESNFVKSINYDRGKHSFLNTNFYDKGWTYWEPQIDFEVNPLDRNYIILEEKNINEYIRYSFF